MGFVELLLVLVIIAVVMVMMIGKAIDLPGIHVGAVPLNCPHCGRETPSDRETCQFCGRSFRDAAAGNARSGNAAAHRPPAGQPNDSANDPSSARPA